MSVQPTELMRSMSLKKQKALISSIIRHAIVANCSPGYAVDFKPHIHPLVQMEPNKNSIH